MQAWKGGVLAGMAVVLAACGDVSERTVVRAAEASEAAGIPFVVRDTLVSATLESTAIAEPFAQATLSTKLMGTVTEVLVMEGDRVMTGQAVVRIDARDLDARRLQVQAGIASAEAMHREAELMATRMRSLYADSAAPRAQLDAAEAGLTRAQAGVSAARAGASELDAVAGYAVIRSPFSGIVTHRFVDRGAFATPGAPLLTIQDDRKLRIAATVPPNVGRRVVRGTILAVSVEGVESTARVEGVVPTSGGSLYTINAVADNAKGALASGGAARLLIGDGTRQAVLIPANALRQEGDLSGVQVTSGGVTTTRWIRVGHSFGAMVEVLSGLSAGDTVRMPTASRKE